jgi:hypothetical protein
MAVRISINPQGGKVSWSILVSHLKLGVYRAYLYGSSKDIWDKQNTADSIPDTFQFKTSPQNLVDKTFWWEVLLSDPTDAGGQCIVHIQIEQEGQVIGTETVTATIPLGAGKLEWCGDTIKFSSTITA